MNPSCEQYPNEKNSNGKYVPRQEDIKKKLRVNTK